MVAAIQIKRTATANNPPANNSLQQGELSVEMATSPPKLWVGVPTTVDATGRILLAQNTSPAALTATNDTNVTLTLGGTPATALLQAASITAGWTGTLAATRLNANVVQAVTNDTNVTGSIATQTLTLGWTGTLANARLANMAATTIKGNNTGSAAAPIDLTVAQVNAILPVFTSTLNGLAPLSGGGTANFLRADGTWAAPTAVASSGTLVLISTQTVTTAVASVSFTGVDATYDEYEVHFWNWQPVSANQAHLLQVSSNNGSTWHTAATDYQYSYSSIFETSANNSSSGGVDVAIYLDNTNSAVAGFGESGVIKFTVPPSLSTIIHACLVDVTGHHSTAGLYRNTGMGMYYANGANNTFNAIRFLASSGNIKSGTYKLFGRVK